MNDTNLVNLLLSLKEHQSSSSQSSLLIITMILAAISPILSATVSWINAAAARKLAQETAINVKEVHTVVNSERTATLTRLEERDRELIRLTRENASLVEANRNKENKIT